MSITTPPERVRDAIELMTAWSDRPDGPPDLLVDCLRRHVDERPEQVRVIVAVELVMSLTYLCGSLLMLREEESGVTAQETLRGLALHFAEG
ncbi:MAG: hypothetical protein ACRDO2_06645 [Nocardioidaceae bacterium]